VEIGEGIQKYYVILELCIGAPIMQITKTSVKPSIKHFAETRLLLLQENMTDTRRHPATVNINVTDRAASSSSNALDLYSRNSRFEYQTGYSVP
jgi:hypothetical protein